MSGYDRVSTVETNAAYAAAGSSNAVMPTAVRGTSAQYAIRAPSAPRLFPPRSEFVGKDPVREPAAFLEAPWLDCDAVNDHQFLWQYVDAGAFPGDVPWYLVTSWTWAYRCAIPESSLFMPRNPADAERRAARCEHIASVYRFVRAVRGRELVRDPLWVDLPYGRWPGEEDYVNELVRLLKELPTNWGDDLRVRTEALCFVRPILPRDFRYRTRSGERYWHDHCRYERRARSRLGLLVPFQDQAVEGLWKRHRVCLLYTSPSPRDA